ncbi:MAG: hypothetical protein HBSAPP03_11870 [Phycisphaerae bacterium]|nr:MAG: hypothetical protein HBSAPP03_11870 [Phycisphaerae bacterium]
MLTRPLILSDGDLPSLVACAAAAEMSLAETDPARRPVVLPFPSALSADQCRAVERQAKVLNLSALPPMAPVSTSADGEAEVRDLLSASYGAARAGIDTVTWPLSATRGDSIDVDRAGRIATRAMLVGRLVGLDDTRHGEPAARIETPYLDLSDTQLADLAADLAVPLETVWWWGSQTGDAARARTRWGAALAAVGWPLVAPRAT